MIDVAILEGEMTMIHYPELSPIATYLRMVQVSELYISGYTPNTGNSTDFRLREGGRRRAGGG